MSLDFSLSCQHCVVDICSMNITHNLSHMAKEAGLYTALWRPEDIGARLGGDLIPTLESGLDILKKSPNKFKKFNPKNGWGDYEGLVEFVENVLEKCRQHPDARINVSR